MATKLDFANHGVNDPSHGQYQYTSNTTGNVLFTNVGQVTVYIGSVLKASTDTISANAGFPLLPGQSVSIPGLLTTDDYVIAYNTAPGTGAGNIRFIAPYDL